jgi:hypothetical protein
MKPTLEHRVEELEKEVAELKRRVDTRSLVIKDWRKGLGMLKDTPLAREASALGEEWRRSQ